jgi:hypothetical protein
VTVEETTAVRGRPVSREGRASAGSYLHQRSRQTSPTMSTERLGMRSRICASVIMQLTSFGGRAGWRGVGRRGRKLLPPSATVRTRMVLWGRK